MMLSFGRRGSLSESSWVVIDQSIDGIDYDSELRHEHSPDLTDRSASSASLLVIPSLRCDDFKHHSLFPIVLAQSVGPDEALDCRDQLLALFVR